MKTTTKKEVIIGICVIVALVSLFLGINFLKGINVFKAVNFYYAEYTNAAGLQVSAPVNVNGFKIGQVRDISYEYDNPGHVKVEIALDKAMKLPKGTCAVIEQDILGTSTIKLEMGSSNEFYKVGETIIGKTASGLMEGVSQEIMPNVSILFTKIDSLLTSLNTIISDPALHKSIQRLDAITASVEQTMNKLNVTAGQLGPVMKNVNGITENIGTMTQELSGVSAKLNNAPIDSTLANINSISENLRELTEDLNNPNSTLGLITHDRALYDNLNNCANALDSLLIDVKKNPKRYISIKLL